MNSTTERPRGAMASWTPFKAIVVGGFLAGLADMSYALLWFSGVKGVAWIKIPQSVAAGLIGRPSFDGGAGSQVPTINAFQLRAVPEPSSIAMMLMGAGGLVALIRLRVRRSA